MVLKIIVTIIFYVTFQHIFVFYCSEISMKLISGVGFSMIMNVFCLNIYYIVVVAWSLYYLFRSFTTTLPWSRCDNPWNTPYCMSSYLNHTNSSFCFDNLALSNASNFPTNSSYSLLDPEDCLNVSLRSTPIKEFWE